MSDQKTEIQKAHERMEQKLNGREFVSLSTKRALRQPTPNPLNTNIEKVKSNE